MNTNSNNIKNHEKYSLSFKKSLQLKPRTIHKVSSFVLERSRSQKISPKKQQKRRSSESYFQTGDDVDFFPKSFSFQIKKVQRISESDVNDAHNLLIQEEFTHSQNVDSPKDNSSLLEQNPNKIYWDFQDEKQQQQQPVKLSFQITIQSVSNSCLKFCLWVSTQHSQITEKKESSDGESFDSNEQENKSQNNKVTYFEESQIAECYIPYSKLLAQEPTLIIKDEMQLEQRIIQIQEKLWSQGQEFGIVDLEIQSLQIPYIKQIFVGVMTEKGVQKSSPSVYYRDGNIDSEINQLEEAKQLLIENMFRLQANDREIVGFERLKLKEEMLNHFNKVYQISQMTHKQSTTSFYYKSQSDLNKAQFILMELADYLLTYADEVDEYLRESYYKCLKMIINRGEFNLENMGFNQSYQQFVKGKASNQSFKTNKKQEIQEIKLKLQAALQYQSLQYKILDKVLTKMESQYINGEEKSFVENYCAIAYFRIPLFQKQFLECLQFSNDSIPDDLKPIFAYFDHKVQIQEGNKVFESMFDWQQFFESYLISDAQGEKNYEFLKKIIIKNTKYWSRINKKGRSYFYFLTEWALYVNNTVIGKDHVPWNELPGYQVLIKSFLLQMSKKETKNYIDSMKIASVNLLLHPGLLKIYINIAYRRTNILDHKNVLCTFNMIDLWMQTITLNQQNIPADFDLKSFFKGIQIVLESDHAMCISKGLTIIYNNYTLLSNDSKQEVCEYLFGNIFFKLFMHWSFNVRYIFHHLLVYRIEHLSKKIQFCQSQRNMCVKQNQFKYSQDRFYEAQKKTEELNKKYLKMMKVLENANYSYQHKYTEQFSNTTKGIFQQSLCQRLKQKLTEKQNKMYNPNQKQSSIQLLNQNEDEQSKMTEQKYQSSIKHTYSFQNASKENKMNSSISPKNSIQEEQNGLQSLFEGFGKDADTNNNSKSILTTQSKYQISPLIGNSSLCTPLKEKKKSHRKNKSVQFQTKNTASLTIIEQSFFNSEVEFSNQNTQIINCSDQNIPHSNALDQIEPDQSVPDQSMTSKNSKADILTNENYMKYFDNIDNQTKNEGNDKPFVINQIKRSQTDEIGLHSFIMEDQCIEDEKEKKTSPEKIRKNYISNSMQNRRSLPVAENLKKISFASPNKKQNALLSGDKFIYIETLDKGNSLKKIEKQFIRYLPKAFEEFMQVKDEYLQWYSVHQETIQQIQGYEKLQKYLKEMEVPQVIMKSSIDGLEGFEFMYED